MEKKINKRISKEIIDGIRGPINTGNFNPEDDPCYKCCHAYKCLETGFCPEEGSENAEN